MPVIQIWEGIVLLPIVGEITTNRGRQVLESLLNAIGQHRAQYALLDITGVPYVDAAVTNYLVQSVRAARHSAATASWWAWEPPSPARW